MTVPIGYVDAWLKFTLAGDPEPMFTALGYGITTPPFSPADAQSLIFGMAATIQPIVSHNFVLAGGQVKVGNDGGDILFDVGLSGSGGASAESVPNNTAILVRKSTGLGGRRGRGRMFIPGPSRDQIEATGAMSGAYRTSWQNAVDGLLDFATLDANVDRAVLFHQTAPFVPTEIVSLTVEQRVATQRRRMR